MSDAGNDTRFCREHAFAGNPLFRVSSILAPQKSRQLTALYALFDLLHRIGRLSQEEGAAALQLAWWRQECLAGDPAGSSHPVLRELHHGGQGRLDQAAFARLIDQVELRLEQPAMTNVGALRSFCEAQGRPLLELESALWPAEDSPRGIDASLAARRGLWSLLTDCFLSAEATGAWWAPLDLLAREGLQRSEIFEPARASQAARLFAEVLSLDEGAPPDKADISIKKQSVAHLHLMDFLVRRKQRKLRGSEPREFPRELSRVRVREFLAMWSMARRISRQK